MHLAQYIPPKQLDFDKNSQESANSDDKGNQFDLCQEKVNKLLNQPIKFEPQIYFLPHKNYKDERIQLNAVDMIPKIKLDKNIYKKIQSFAQQSSNKFAYLFTSHIQLKKYESQKFDRIFNFDDISFDLEEDFDRYPPELTPGQPAALPLPLPHCAGREVAPANLMLHIVLARRLFILFLGGACSHCSCAAALAPALLYQCRVRGGGRQTICRM